MNILEQMVSGGGIASNATTLANELSALLLAFILGQVVAWVYVYTHQGLSYSRAFVQSIILLTIIICLAMMVIGSQIVIAFGLIGALSVIRFRNILKDTRDTAFIFFSLIIGMASGTGAFQLAFLGVFFFTCVLLYLHWTQFGSRNTSDGFLRFNIAAGEMIQEKIMKLLRRHCRRTQLVSQRFQEDGSGEIAFRLAMRDPNRSDAMIEEMQDISGLSNVTFVLHEDQSEV